MVVVDEWGKFMQYRIADLLVATAVVAGALCFSIYVEENQNLIFFGYQQHLGLSLAAVGCVLAFIKCHMQSDIRKLFLKDIGGLSIASGIALLVWCIGMFPFLLVSGAYTDNIYNRHSCLQWWCAIFYACLGMLLGIGVVQVGKGAIRKGLICLVSAVALFFLVNT